jgi:hypothetical protein
MSDEAIFSLNGSVNKQNCQYWAPTNPCQLHEQPLHSPHVILWCVIPAQGIIGPYFFEGDDGVSVTVNAERYNHMLDLTAADFFFMGVFESSSFYSHLP